MSEEPIEIDTVLGETKENIVIDNLNTNMLIWD